MKNLENLLTVVLSQCRYEWGDAPFDEEIFFGCAVPQWLTAKLVDNDIKTPTADPSGS